MPEDAFATEYLFRRKVGLIAVCTSVFDNVLSAMHREGPRVEVLRQYGKISRIDAAETPSHSASGFHTASHEVVGITRPELPRYTCRIQFV